jgi:dihydropteroate synthase
LEEGADILDLGGESTRPGVRVRVDGGGDAAAGKPPVSAAEELQRVMPVLEAVLRARPDAVVSIDTYKSEVARAAVNAGAEIVNDVSALEWDPQMARICGELKCGVVMMHTRGRPNEWQTLPAEPDIVQRVEHDLANRIQVAFERGIERQRIVLDPGFGFGKNFAENYALLAGLERMRRLGFPLLAGTSRKSFIGKTVGLRLGKNAPPDARLAGSLAATVVSILQGAHIVRVHDVKTAVQAAAVADEVMKLKEA